MNVKKTVPVWIAVFAGWFCAYVLLFILPVFLNAGHAMVFPRTVPTLKPAGADLQQMVVFSRDWLQTGRPGSCYPALTALLFAPLAGLSQPAAHAVMTAVTLLAFLSVVVVLPLRVFPRADRAAVAAVAVAGLFSYGLQFELERGQYNVLAAACTAWAVYLFHRGTFRGARWAACGLFCAAVQMKLYPAIFAVALAKDARAWKANLARWAGLGAVNAALLFLLGPEVFADFLRLVRQQAVEPYVWAGNHSMMSFAAQIGAAWVLPACAAVFGLCLLRVLARQVRPGGPGPFAALILVAGLGAMLIPAVSHDYKLTVFTLAFAFYAAAAAPARGGGAAALGLLAFLHGWTQFSFMLKPAGLQNNAPVLLAAAVLAAAWPGPGASPEPE